MMKINNDKELVAILKNEVSSSLTRANNRSVTGEGDVVTSLLKSSHSITLAVNRDYYFFEYESKDLCDKHYKFLKERY